MSRSYDISDESAPIIRMQRRLQGPHDRIDALETEAALHRTMATEAQKMAYLDKRTGLPRGDTFLPEYLAELGKNSIDMAILFIDLNGFKPLNDMHGHEAGDVALANLGEMFDEYHAKKEDPVVKGRQISDVLSLLRTSNAGALGRRIAAIRYGGDEFVFILTGYNEADAIKLAERVRRQIGARVHDISKVKSAQEKVARVTASVGVAAGHVEPGKLLPSTLMTLADLAVYSAKESPGGKDVTCVAKSADNFYRIDPRTLQAMAIPKPDRRAKPRQEVANEHGKLPGVLRKTRPAKPVKVL